MQHLLVHIKKKGHYQEVDTFLMYLQIYTTKNEPI